MNHNNRPDNFSDFLMPDAENTNETVIIIESEKDPRDEDATGLVIQSTAEETERNRRLRIRQEDDTARIVHGQVQNTLNDKGGWIEPVEPEGDWDDEEPTVTFSEENLPEEVKKAQRLMRAKSIGDDPEKKKGFTALVEAVTGTQELVDEPSQVIETEEVKGASIPPKARISLLNALRGWGKK